MNKDPQKWFDEDWMPDKCGCITYDKFGFYLWRSKPAWNKRVRCWGNPPGDETDRGKSWVGGFPVKKFAADVFISDVEPRYWVRKVKVGEDDIPVHDHPPGSQQVFGLTNGPVCGETHQLPKGYFGKNDSEKTQFGLLPWRALTAVADLMTRNAESHGADGWKTRENGQERYREALQRHVAAMWRGEEEDPDGFHHLAAVAANALIALELKINDEQDKE